VVGLRFTGLVKVREFACGYEWARFQWRPDRTGWVDHLLTGFLRLCLTGRFHDYVRRFRDVHERNVVFEVRSWMRRGVPVLARDAAGADQGGAGAATPDRRALVGLSRRMIGCSLTDLPTDANASFN
jgi:hypothetical protein